MTAAFCNYPGKRRHPLGTQYYQVPDYGDICELCHREWLEPDVYGRPEPRSDAVPRLAPCPTCAAFVEIWCRNEPCTNRARYSSGYCGVCDVVLNNGRGVLL